MEWMSGGMVNCVAIGKGQNERKVSTFRQTFYITSNSELNLYSTIILSWKPFTLSASWDFNGDYADD